MKKNFIIIALAFAATATAQNIAALDNDALYMWTAKDGTPTYSPDPPPSGVDFVVVGANLNPLPVQPPQTGAAAVAIPTTPASPALPAPNPKSIPKWKPVRYANNPNRTAVQLKASDDPGPRKEPSDQVQIQTSTRPESNECQILRRETQIMEDFFAQSTTAAEMDQAILKLHNLTKNYRQRCN